MSSSSIMLLRPAGATHVPEPAGAKPQARTWTWPCPFCIGSMRLWKRVPADCKKGTPNPHANVHWCDACGYGAVCPTPSAEEVVGFYHLDAYYTQGKTHFEAAGRRTWLDRVRVHLAWRLDAGCPLTAGHLHELMGGRPSRVCDVGCGSGRLAAELSRLGHDVSGVEIDPDAVVHRRAGGFEVFTGTAEALPAAVRERRFDCVVLSHVLEHCRAPLHALENIRGLLAPGGLLVCEVPNNEVAALEHSGAAWEMFDVPRHLCFFTTRSLQLALQQTGYSVQSIRYAHYVRQFDNRWIHTERKLWRHLMQVQPAPDPVPKPNGRWRAWQLLAKTCLAPPARKYDSIRMVAKLRT